MTLHVYEKGHAYPFEFKGLHNAQLSDIKVYTYTDGVKGTQNLLEGKSTEADGYKLKYTTELAAGDYWVDGYDANGDFNGGTVISVAVGRAARSPLGRVYQIYASNSGWVKDTDYIISYQLSWPTAPSVRARWALRIPGARSTPPACMWRRHRQSHADPDRRQGGGISGHHRYQDDRRIERPALACPPCTPRPST